MKVFIVEQGECHEGGSVQGVYSTYEKAFESIKSYHEDGAWKLRMTDELNRPFYWRHGCDYLEITEHEVE